jgi:hypothetical protein
MGKLTAATPDYKKKEVTLVFADQLPDHLPTDAILFDHRYGSHNCIIKNCYFHENRARGILCNTADWLIEGNRFFHNQFSAMLLIADIGPSWSEGFGARNVIIRDNRFDSVNAIGSNDGAVIALSATSNGWVTPYPLVENVLLEHNTFREMPGPAIEAASFKNLVIRQNTIVNEAQAPLSLKMRGSIRAEKGSGLWIEANNWTTKHGIDAPGLFYDPATTSDMVRHDCHCLE